MSEKKIITIQYLRAIAALMVLVCHAFATIKMKTTDLLYFPIAEIGKYGVNTFFVISGMIMSLIAVRENTSQLFIKRRIARVYPTYLEVYLITFLLWLILDNIFHLSIFSRIFLFNGTSHSSTFSDWFVNLTLLYYEDANKAREMVTLPVIWTLYYEVFFYIVVGLSIALFNKPKYGIYLFFLLAIFNSPLFNFIHLSANLFLELIAGFVLIEFIKKDRDWLDFVVLVTSAIALLRVGHDGWAALITMIIFLVGLRLEDKSKYQYKVLDLIGSASYSLYLIQWPLLVIGWFMLDKINIALMQLQFLEIYRLAIISLGCICILALIVFVATLNYLFFEKKLAIAAHKN